MSTTSAMYCVWKKGDWVVACNGEGKDYVSRIASIEKEQVVLQVEKSTGNRNRAPDKDHIVSGIA